MRRAVLRTVAVLAWLAIVTGAAAGAVTAQEDDPADPGPLPGQLGEPVAPLTDKRLYDMADVLSDREEAQIEQHAARLARHGIPSLIVVQASSLTPGEARGFAAEIRQSWAVESSPDAEDGLVILVIVGRTDNPAAFGVMSWGERTLPHFGVDAETVSRVETEWLNAWIEQGDDYGGIDNSLRRLIYHTIYEPAPQEPLTTAQSTARAAIGVAAPVLAIGAVAIAIARWRFSRQAVLRRRGDTFVWGTLVACAVVAALSVWSRSELGALAAIVLLGVIAAEWVRGDPFGAGELARP